MELVGKKELVKEFDVEASFYDVKIGDTVFDCRSQARIKRKGVKAENYEALLILCNPGSCNAVIKPSVLELDPRKDEIPFIKADSDPTMWQIMRLMQLKKWNQVNIINLSDLCTGNLSMFKEYLNKANAFSFTYHSLFSTNRRAELQRIIDSNIGPIIIGWGVEPYIKGMAKDALQHKLITSPIGCKHKDAQLYYHPNPRIEERKKQWLICILGLIEEFSEES